MWLFFLLRFNFPIISLFYYRFYNVFNLDFFVSNFTSVTPSWKVVSLFKLDFYMYIHFVIEFFIFNHVLRSDLFQSCKYRAWVGNLKQRVPITSKSSKFKGTTQHYVAKLPKSAGVRHYCPKSLRMPGTLGTD